jgi:hypothetical protein
MSGATFDLNTIINSMFIIAIIVVLLFIILPIIKLKKSVKNYTKTYKGPKIPSKNDVKSGAQSFINEKLKPFVTNNKIFGGVGAGLGLIFTLLQIFNLISLDIEPGVLGIISVLLGGISGLFLGKNRYLFDPKKPYLWKTITVGFVIILAIVLRFYSKELNHITSPQKYQTSATINRILTVVFTIMVCAALVWGLYIWMGGGGIHANNQSEFPNGDSATFTSQTGWLLKELKNYLFILSGVGVISFILFLIVLFSFTKKGAIYSPYIITFVLGTVGATLLYLFLKTVGKPVLDKLLAFKGFKLIYHILFLIPCFLLDIINSIYTEFKSTPKIAYTLFTIEMIIILAVIAGPVITSTLYKHHPNTNIKIMKQTLDSEYNSLDQTILDKKQKIKKLKRYGLFEKNWLSTGSKFWDKILHNKWYEIDNGDSSQQRKYNKPDTYDEDEEVITGEEVTTFINSNFIHSFGQNFNDDNSELINHWLYVSEDDKTNFNNPIGAGKHINNLKQEIQTHEDRKIKIEAEKASNDGFAMTKVLKMQPFKIDYGRVISTYKDIYTNGKQPSPLYGKGNFDYALSFWTFFHSTPSESCIDKYYKVISYGNKPTIYFNPIKRKLAVTLGIDQKCDTDECLNAAAKGRAKLDGWNEDDLKKTGKNSLVGDIGGKEQKLLGVIKNIKLQRWNNLVINCNNGVLDIFINGKLNSSYNIDFRNNPLLDNNTIVTGETNGIDAGICNIVFFSTHISKTKIKTLYNSLKNKDPPIIFDLDTFFK